MKACEDLQESILPAPGQYNLTSEQLAEALTGARNGANVDKKQEIWIAGKEKLPVLCTNSAPLSRSNVTSYDTSRQITIDTPSAGLLRGYRDKFGFRFLGINYAEPTSGEARFEPPTMLKVEKGTERDALQYGPMCAQPPSFLNYGVVHPSEDCLTVNVYTPIVPGKTFTKEELQKLPVMVWYHGGGLVYGDNGPFPYNTTSSGYVGNSISNPYDGSNLVSYGHVVLVVANYRLNAFGWFNGKNAAVRDGILALNWVKENIAAFGGDSAGGFMVRYLLGANYDYTRGLFHRAILESDFPTGNGFMSLAKAEENYLLLAEALKCAPVNSTKYDNEVYECVKRQTVDSIAMAVLSANPAWGAVIDGDIFKEDFVVTIEKGNYPRVPTLWTSNNCEYAYQLGALSETTPPSDYPGLLLDYFNTTQAQKILARQDLYPYKTAPAVGPVDGTVMTLAMLMTDYDVRCAMQYLAALQTRTSNPGQVYLANFMVGLHSPLTPNDLCVGPTVCHGDEIYWVMATAETDNLYQPLSKDQLKVTQDVMSRWTELAWTGNPNPPSANVHWTPFVGDNSALIDWTDSVVPYRTAQCEFLVNDIGMSL
ncbi:hypothetical protein BZG36_00593 [Bifiguratus adelaidae]|uniref:Carboxylesterase type B domain-containing protein n=1 Tax=Bifiguratus adelaidae TaxID=1938954 RepID=A0A261Y755_9FUNG|nr:hypothetical protein BZG36_00593 [Bifiguratus adelaidae]